MIDRTIEIKSVEQSALKMLELKRKQKQMQESLQVLTSLLMATEKNFVNDVQNNFGYLPNELILNLKYESILVTFDVDDGCVVSVSVPHLLEIDAEIAYTA